MGNCPKRRRDGRAGGSAALTDVSLVDAVSFICIREARVDEVFAFDRHFESEGFPIAR